MSNDSLPEGDSGSESGRSVDDDLGTAHAEAAQAGNDASYNRSRAAASVLGAQTAFQLDASALAQVQDQIGRSVLFHPEALASMQAVADSLARVALPRETLEKLANAAALAGQVALPRETLEKLANAAALAGQVALPKETLASLQAGIAAATLTAFPEGYWQQFEVTARLLNESVSVPALYSRDQLVLRSREEKTSPRASRSAEAFFDEHSVDITDVRSLLKALSAIQTKHHMHRLVWRGQQDAAWSVHSSLYRKLEASEHPSEDRLIAAEMTGMQHAGKWGQSTAPALEFFAELQHYGAPTRLLDGTVDPEIAAWFAVEASPKFDDKDGRIIAWGRTVRTTPRKVSEANDELPVRDDAPFWHSWTSDEERGRVGWGTGSRTWSWFPPALSDRMRAQRAGFLLEAGPLVTPTVAEVLSAGVTHDWRVAEITRATSIIGLPSRHDVRTVPNEANLVPLFSLRIAASAKPAIRGYLKSKGLFFSTVYPDRGGLVDYLKGPFGLDPHDLHG